MGLKATISTNFGECHAGIAAQVNSLLNADQIRSESLTIATTVLCVKNTGKDNTVDS